jgi:hypothetical protein
MATADDWCLTEVVSSVGATRFFRKNLQPRIAPGDTKYATLAFVTFRYESSDPRCLPEEHDRQALDGLDSSEAFDLEHDGIAVHAAPRTYFSTLETWAPLRNESCRCLSAIRGSRRLASFQGTRTGGNTPSFLALARVRPPSPRPARQRALALIFANWENRSQDGVSSPRAAPPNSGLKQTRISLCSTRCLALLRWARE